MPSSRLYLYGKCVIILLISEWVNEQNWKLWYVPIFKRYYIKGLILCRNLCDVNLSYVLCLLYTLASPPRHRVEREEVRRGANSTLSLKRREATILVPRAYWLTPWKPTQNGARTRRGEMRRDNTSEPTTFSASRYLASPRWECRTGPALNLI